MIIPKPTAFAATRTADLTEVRDVAGFLNSPAGRLEIEPAGRMQMVPWQVTNRPEWSVFATETDFPPMSIASLDDVYCLPYGPPFLPFSKQVITDYLDPLTPRYAPWFTLADDGS